MKELVDTKPAGSYNELATCHAQRVILGDGDSGLILETCVRPSIQNGKRESSKWIQV